MTDDTDVPFDKNIHKLLSLELHHVSKDTMDALKRNDSFGIIYRTVEEGGWLISTYAPGGTQFAAALPLDLKLLLDVARAHGCVYVLLERNGETHPKLPLYSW